MSRVATTLFFIIAMAAGCSENAVSPSPGAPPINYVGNYSDTVQIWQCTTVGRYPEDVTFRVTVRLKNELRDSLRLAFGTVDLRAVVGTVLHPTEGKVSLIDGNFRLSFDVFDSGAYQCDVGVYREAEKYAGSLVLYQHWHSFATHRIVAERIE